MSKSPKKLDKNQLSFDFDRKIEEYVSLKSEIINRDQGPPKEFESYEEACIEIASACKRAIRTSGLSREQLVDAVNDFFGWTGKKGKRLTIHMFNHFLSKPAKYPISAFYLFAIQRITGSLEPTQALAEAEGARVVSRDDCQLLALGRLDKTILEMQKLKKELRK